IIAIAWACLVPAPGLPAGLALVFFATPEKVDRIAMVYKIEKGKLKRSGDDILGGDPASHRRGAKYPAPEFGLYSTAHDLSLFYQMMLNGGNLNGKRILSKASVEVATALHTAQIEPAGHSP